MEQQENKEEFSSPVFRNYDDVLNYLTKPKERKGQKRLSVIAAIGDWLGGASAVFNAARTGQPLQFERMSELLRKRREEEAKERQKVVDNYFKIEKMKMEKARNDAYVRHMNNESKMRENEAYTDMVKKASGRYGELNVDRPDFMYKDTMGGERSDEIDASQIVFD